MKYSLSLLRLWAVDTSQVVFGAGVVVNALRPDSW